MASTQTEMLATELPRTLEITWRTVLEDLHKVIPKSTQSEAPVWELAARVGAVDALTHHGGELAVEYASAWLERGDSDAVEGATSPYDAGSEENLAFLFVQKTLLGSLFEWRTAIEDPEEDVSTGFDFNGALLPDAALRAAADLLNSYRDGLTYGLPVRRSKLALDMGRVWALLYLVDVRVEMLWEAALYPNPWQVYVKLADWLRLRVQAIAMERGDEPEMPVGDRTMNAAIAAAAKAEYMPELAPSGAEAGVVEAEAAERTPAQEAFAKAYDAADFKIDMAWIGKYMGGAPARESRTGFQAAVARMLEQLTPRERELLEKMRERHEERFPEMARLRRMQRARAQEDLAVKAFRTGFVLGRELGRTEPGE